MFQREVIEKTLSEIRSFLEEISNGTSRYKSLHNLTEQIEHQYHGRFLVELIQNAHDALYPRGEGDDQRRIDIVLAEEEPFGALYVANDGRPFASSNFRALSNLGQSDKDPVKDIGNKGIGFRSVLEISRAPEIYSRSKVGSAGFDGYCFRFIPSVNEMFVEPILDLLRGKDRVYCRLDDGEPLVQWESRRLQAFRSNYGTKGREWLLDEFAYLSPYALPIPISTSEVSPVVRDFDKRGYATVVRLPLISNKAWELTKNRIKSLDRNSTLFLERVKLLRLVDGAEERSYRRDQVARDAGVEDGIDVRLTPYSGASGKAVPGTPERYWVWTRAIGGAADPEGASEIKESVERLPGKWPQLRETMVAIAVRVTEQPERGVVNIYLPTAVESGCAAHFNAPFYGDMSRTTVDFSNLFNSLLLRKIAEKTVNVVVNDLAGKGKEEAAAIVDLIAPNGRDSGERWWEVLKSVFETSSTNIHQANLCFTDNGWRRLEETKLLPDLRKMSVVKDDMFRAGATYPVFSRHMSTRELQIDGLIECLGINPLAEPNKVADTIEKVAGTLHEQDGIPDWSGFWRDVRKLLNNNCAPLRGKKVLLGTDGQLHSSGPNSSVFFRPSRHGTDDEVSSDEAIHNVPANLRPFIAFLSESIETHERVEKGRPQPTDIHAYLSQGLVSTFGIEQIFRSVLLPATPILPVPNGSEKEGICGDILLWGLRLGENLVSRDKGERTLELLGRLPAPCKGGWYPLGETSFGPDWEGTAGLDVQIYLQAVKTPESKEAESRLLLPPDHSSWGVLGLSRKYLLEKAGVMDGLRPIFVGKEKWTSSFSVVRWGGFVLPTTPPPCFSEKIWEKFCEDVRANVKPWYDGPFEYQIQDLYAIPGLDRFDMLTDEARIAFARAILASIEEWAKQGEWKTVSIRKIEGRYHSPSVRSPMVFVLEELPWLTVKDDEELYSFRPRDRWYIPSLGGLGGRRHYGHLRLVPSEIASVLAHRRDLVSTLATLGMPIYDEDASTSDPRLLNDLAEALKDPNREIANMDVFVGQVRNAWRLFEPIESGPVPELLIVRNGDRQQTTVEPTRENPIYLPNATWAVHAALALHSKPIIVVEPTDAVRLQTWFKRTFGESVLLASELDVVPLVSGVPRAMEGGRPLADFDLDWLCPVILAISAYATGQSKGTGTKKFRDAMDRLRKVNLVWVENLAVGLWKGKERVAATPVPAIWDSKSKILVCTPPCRDRYSDLTEALTTILDRSDLGHTLELALSKLEGNEIPSEGQILTVMGKLKVSDDRYFEVCQKWLGDLSWTIRMLRPLVLTLLPGADLAAIAEVTTEAQLQSILGTMDLAPFYASEVLQMTKTARGFFALGEKIYEDVGNRAQLDCWNSTLAELGEAALRNEYASQEFIEHLAEARMPFRSVIRHLIRLRPELGKFLDLDRRLDEVECPAEYSTHFWQIEFIQAVKVVAEMFRSLGAEEKIVGLIASAETVRDLREKLNAMGLQPDLDPVAIQAENQKRLSHILENIQKAAIAWCISNEVETGIWEEPTEGLMKYFAEVLERGAFVDIWDEHACLGMIQMLPRSQVHDPLWAVFARSASVTEILEGLQLSEKDLSKALDRLESYKKALEEMKKTVTVCGRKFHNKEDNLWNLWDHITLTIVEEMIPLVDLTKYDSMDDLERARKDRRQHDRVGKKKRKPPGRPSQAMKDLIGLAGEIHAFRALQKSYGSEVVGPNCWVSGNSRYKYPENEVDDSLGCDFRFTNDRKTYFVEVKATQDDDESFELGYTEVGLAIETAGSKKEIFQVLHVVNALSVAPQFRLLPNPYDQRHKDKYRLEDAGLKVRYKLATG